MVGKENKRKGHENTSQDILALLQGKRQRNVGPTTSLSSQGHPSHTTSPATQPLSSSSPQGAQTHSHQHDSAFLHTPPPTIGLTTLGHGDSPGTDSGDNVDIQSQPRSTSLPQSASTLPTSSFTKPSLSVKNGHFIPRDKRPTNIIGQVIKKKFDGAWPKFSHVPSNVRQIWWDDFKSHWSISKDDEGLVRSLFEKRCGERLKDMLFTVHTCYATMEKIPAWIPVTVFEKLLEYWESEDFMKASTANKSNRNRISDEGLPVGKYAGGSRSSHDVKACMEKVLGRPVAIAEVFMFTHTNKKDKVPIDDSAAVIEELFRERMPNIFEYFGKKDPIPDELLREADEVFLECAGGVKNGRIKGLGNLSSEYTSGSVSHTMPNEVLTQQVSQLLEENSRLREDLSAVRESLAEERESNGLTICNADGDSKDCATSPRIPPYSRWCLIVRIMDCSYFAVFCVVTLFCFGNPKWNNISFCNLLISYMEPLLTWFG